MTRDEIDDLYRKSFRSVQDENSFPCSVFDRYEFAKLVAAKEREACAKVCDTEFEKHRYSSDAIDCAKAIRARGEA